MLVIGNREMEANAVSVRIHGHGNLGARSRDEVIADQLASVDERRP
jgi:threonyl-tRNA synthetase